MATIYCEKRGGFTDKCYLYGGEKYPECNGCRYYKPTWKRWQFTRHGDDLRLKIDTSKVKLEKNPPEPKKAYFRLPKKKFRLPDKFSITDPVTEKPRRVLWKDLKPRLRFHSVLCFLCREAVKQVQREFCKKKGYDLKNLNELLNKLKSKDRLNLILEGKQLFLNKSIPQIMRQPEMTPFRPPKLRTLAGWRKEHCGQNCIRENPTLKIPIGRREKE